MARKPKSVSKLKDKADWLFSRLVRLSRADKSGFVSCVTCGIRRPWNHGSIHAGHFRSRRFNSTRYDLLNCWPQCNKCNTYHGGEQYLYGRFLNAEYGNDMADSLVARSNEIKQWTPDELEELIESMRTRLKTLGDPYWNK